MWNISVWFSFIKSKKIKLKKKSQSSFNSISSILMPWRSLVSDGSTNLIENSWLPKCKQKLFRAGNNNDDGDDDDDDDNNNRMWHQKGKEIFYKYEHSCHHHQRTSSQVKREFYLFWRIALGIRKSGSYLHLFWGIYAWPWQWYFSALCFSFSVRSVKKIIDQLHMHLNSWVLSKHFFF